MEQTLIKRRVMLIIAVIVMLFAGIMYAWTITQTPFMIIENGVFINATQLGVNYTITIIFFCLGCFATGLIVNQTSTAIRFALGAMMLFASYFSASFQIITLQYSGNYFLLYMASGLLGGLGIGIVYATVLSIINLWFPDKPGFASGLIMTGFGLSLLLTGSAVEALGGSETVGWERTYIIIAFTMAVVFAAAAFLLKLPPAGTVLPEPKPRPDDENQQKSDINKLSALEMVKRPSFIFIFIYLAILAASGSAAIAFATDIMQDMGATAGLVVLAGGILCVSNSTGRIALGFLFDKIGIKQTQLISSAIAILAPVTIIMALASGSVIIGVIGLFLCGLSYGFVPVSCSVFASEFFGTKEFSLKFGILSMVLLPAPFIVMLAGFLKNPLNGYMYIFIGLAALTVIGVFINLIIRKP